MTLMSSKKGTNETADIGRRRVREQSAVKNRKRKARLRGKATRRRNR